MTDETPTERFDAAGDAPTERLTPADAAAIDPALAGASPEVQEERKSRKLLIILGSVGGALLIILIILLILLLVKPGGSVTPTGSPSPSPTATASASATPTQSASASASPTPTPTPTPTQTVAPPPPPPPSGPIKSFTVDDDTVDCEGVNTVTMHFEWETEGTTLWFGVGTNNAKAAPYDTFPLVYELDFDYQCGQSSGQQTYTISVEQSNGDLNSKTITVKE